MCPVCMSTAAMMVASVTSTGGVTALVLKKLPGWKSGHEGERRNDSESPRSESAADRVAR
jgi:hypothetical protein